MLDTTTTTAAPSPRTTTVSMHRALHLLIKLFICKLLLWWAIRTVPRIPIAIITRVMYRDRSYHVFQIHRNITNMVRCFMQFVQSKVWVTWYIASATRIDIRPQSQIVVRVAIEYYNEDYEMK
ncbi:unnamed protein product [Chrysodeixis includens]|uniref:Uncharacterized protein n=1 Tax=Chrysodeixis includens TaxID=689277 RepID=A0A9N8Q1K3_CHRIL|nr:unnamed protein product [Chrysodeixis includens]